MPSGAAARDPVGMPEPDPVLTRIARAQQGDRDDVRRELREIWDEVGPDGDPLRRCALAHAMADVQDDPHDELAWDLLALESADQVSASKAAEAGVPGRAGFYPSLHLNLGDVYRRLGDLAAARRHVELGRAAVGALGDDGYGRMITAGLDRLAERIEPGSVPGSVVRPAASVRRVTVIGSRALNRALLARQLLLDRHAIPAIDALEHLVGLQAQEPLEPYTALWSRLHGFDSAELVDLLETRLAVRTLLMRRTLHLVTAEDCLALRALHQPMHEQRMLGTLRRRLPGVDMAELAAAGEPLFAEQPRTLSEVARAVGDRWPDVEARDLGDALSSILPLVQVPPRGLWGQTGAARCTTVEAWLGRSPADPAPPADGLVLRYLAAFGPSATADIRAWSGLTGLPAAIARLRPALRVFRDERGRELLDLPDAPCPDPDTPAPPRFLPAFDNAVLGLDDRTRIIDDEHRGLSVTGARFVLVDGRVAATWSLEHSEQPAILRIEPFAPLAKADLDAVTEEGERLLSFLTDGAPGGRVVARAWGP